MAELNIFEKLSAIQTVLNVPKNQFNSFAKYNYRSCEDIIEAVKPLLKTHDCVLLLDDEIVFIEGRFYVKATATLYDAKTEANISTHGFAREIETKGAQDLAQITGACSSYARKYALNALFAVDDTKDADTDENAIQSEAKDKKDDTKDADTDENAIQSEAKDKKADPKPKKTTKTTKTAEKPEEPKEPGEIIFCDSCNNPIEATAEYTIEQIVGNSRKYLNGCYCMDCGRKKAAEIKAARLAKEKKKAEAEERERAIANLDAATERLINGDM